MSSPSPKETSSSSLKTRIDAVDATKKSHPLFTIANEIYNAFFETPKKGTKKFLTEHLTEKLTEIEKAIPEANKAGFKNRIEKVRTDLQTATSTSTSTAAVSLSSHSTDDSSGSLPRYDVDVTVMQNTSS